MGAVVDGPRMTDLTALDGVKDAGIRSLQESLDELALEVERRRDCPSRVLYIPWEMGGSEVKGREVNPLRIKARMSTANRNAVDGASPILRRRERINDSTNSNESALRSSQKCLGNVSHSRVDDGKAVRCKGRKCDDGSRQGNLPERAGLQEIDLKRRVNSEIV